MNRTGLYVLIGAFAALDVLASAWGIHLVADTPGQPYAATQEIIGVLSILGGVLLAVILFALAGKR